MYLHIYLNIYHLHFRLFTLLISLRPNFFLFPAWNTFLLICCVYLFHSTFSSFICCSKIFVSLWETVKKSVLSYPSHSTNAILLNVILVTLITWCMCHVVLLFPLFFLQVYFSLCFNCTIKRAYLPR